MTLYLWITRDGSLRQIFETHDKGIRWLERACNDYCSVSADAQFALEEYWRFGVSPLTEWTVVMDPEKYPEVC